MVSVDRPASGVARVRLGRERKKNAFNTALLTDLQAAMAALAADFPNTRVIILTGAGSTFCAGADIKEMAESDEAAVLEFVRFGAEVFSTLQEMPQPIIAAIGGYALGGGLELALACDLRIAGADAQLGFPEVGIGGVPGWGGTVRAQEIVGRGHAARMIFTSEFIGADEAGRIGLVNFVVPIAELAERSMALATQLAARSPQALKMAKLALNAGSPYRARAQSAIEQFTNMICTRTKEREAALTGFGNASGHD